LCDIQLQIYQIIIQQNSLMDGLLVALELHLLWSLLRSLQFWCANPSNPITKLQITRERVQISLSHITSNFLRVVVFVMVLEDTCAANLVLRNSQERVVRISVLMFQKVSSPSVNHLWTLHLCKPLWNMIFTKFISCYMCIFRDIKWKSN
jgi:hypothetical protein